MSLRINHNIAAINGHRNMIKNDAAISRSLEKLSSGLRINKGADDAAGLVISEQMRAQITGLSQAIDNSEAAVSMVQTAEGALDEMNTLLNKARELTLHAANVGVNDTNQLTADQTELDNIVESITRIANNTQFGTKKLLDGTLGTSTINTTSAVTAFEAIGIANGTYAVGVTAGVLGSVSTTISDANAASMTNAANSSSMTAGSTWDATTTLAIDTVSVTVAAGTTVSAGMTALNEALVAANKGVTVTFTSGVAATSDAIVKINSTESGTYANGYTLTITGGFTSGAVADGTNVAVAAIDSQTFSVTNNRGLNLTTTAGSSITLAANTTAANANAVTVHDGAIFQIGANAGQTVELAIKSVRAADLGLASLATVTGKSLNSLATENYLLTASLVQDALKIIDKATDDVTNLRGKLGAFQSNTLESGINSLRVTGENLTAAESTIRDVDFAAESATFTKSSILIQSATAMLAQANQLPQNVLQLLGG